MASIGLPGSVLTALPLAGQTEKLQLLYAALGRPIAIAHGLHLVGGNGIFQYEVPSGADQGKTILFLAHGADEWEGPVLIWVNGRLFDHTNTAKYHFHPGLDGELGVETDPATRNQKICSLWPAAFADRFTFSRTAYSAFKLDPDPRAPDASFRIVGIFKTRRVRVFDSSGTQTAYQYSANNADIWADLLISAFLKPRGLVNEALTTAEKAKLNFTAYDAYRTDCDAATPQGTKRCEAHPAFVNETELIRALNLVVNVLGRGYSLEFGGKLAPYLDKSRSSQVTIGPDQIAAGTLQHGDKDVTDLASRYLARYRNLESGVGQGTLSTTGTAVTGVATKFLSWFRTDEVCQLEDGAQVGQAREVASVASDTSMTLKTAFSADQSGRKYSNPAVHFMDGSKVAEDEPLQEETGRVLSEELELNNQTAERAERIVKYIKGRNLDLEKQVALRALPIAGLRDLLPGDRITTLKSQDLDPANTKDFTIVNMGLLPDGEVEIAGEEYDESILSDVAGAQQAAVPSLPGGGLPAVTGAANYAYRPRSNPLTGTDAGATATVSIAAFTMEISQVGQKSISSGSITALSFNTLYFIAYKDPSLAGGSVTFEAFTTKENALQEGRFLVGSILTPRDGASDTLGNNDGGVGAQTGALYKFFPGTHADATTGGESNWSNQGNAYDQDEISKATKSVNGGTVNKSATLTLSQVPGSFQPWKSLKLKIKSAVPTNSLDGGTVGAAVLSYSTDGGLNYTVVYSLDSGSTRAVMIDSITLGVSQNTGRVQVRMLTKVGLSDTTGTVTGELYEAWIEAES